LKASKGDLIVGLDNSGIFGKLGISNLEELAPGLLSFTTELSESEDQS